MKTLGITFLKFKNIIGKDKLRLFQNMKDDSTLDLNEEALCDIYKNFLNKMLL